MPIRTSFYHTKDVDKIELVCVFLITRLRIRFVSLVYAKDDNEVNNNTIFVAAVVSRCYFRYILSFPARAHIEISHWAS